MKKYLYLFSLIVVFSSLAIGVENNKGDEDQAKVALQTLLLSMQNYEASFAQTVTDAEGEVLQESEGKIFLKQPNRLYWEVSEPNETILIADGQTAWHVDPFVEQVIAMDQSKAVENNPMILLTSSDMTDWDQFDVVKNGQEFEVTSRDLDSQISKLTFVFSGMTMTSLYYSDRTEQVSALKFSAVKQNQNIDDALFNFTLPPGFELDDQR